MTQPVIWTLRSEQDPRWNLDSTIPAEDNTNMPPDAIVYITNLMRLLGTLPPSDLTFAVVDNETP